MTVSARSPEIAILRNETALRRHWRPQRGELVDKLAAALESEDIRYCQWKGSRKRGRWSKGDGDIDLLVDRAGDAAFNAVMSRLGFRSVVPARGRGMAGTAHYLGMDHEHERLIHVHAHFRLVLGESWRTLYYPGMEDAVLASSMRGLTFRTPAPVFEYLLLVLQQTLKNRNRIGKPDSERAKQLSLRNELARLRSRFSCAELVDVLRLHLPELDADFIKRCVRSLAPECSPLERYRVRNMLRLALSSHASPRRLRRFASGALWKATDIARRVLRMRPMAAHKLGHGGSVIAISGTDGSGKSTCAHYLSRWLGSSVRFSHMHLGRPPRSLLTFLSGLMLRISRGIRTGPVDDQNVFVAHFFLLRHVCTARDRYRLHLRARRIAASGGIVICERYPIPEAYALVGPSATQGLALRAQSGIARRLRRIEDSYYARLRPPDITLFLDVDPETAVRRKTDEPEEYVRKRAILSDRSFWESSKARIIDARRSLPNVVHDLREHIWRSL